MRIPGRCTFPTGSPTVLFARDGMHDPRKLMPWWHSRQGQYVVLDPAAPAAAEGKRANALIPIATCSEAQTPFAPDI